MEQFLPNMKSIPGGLDPITQATGEMEIESDERELEGVDLVNLEKAYQ
jgi:hypothetical protein